jgi:hypothetical protein
MPRILPPSVGPISARAPEPARPETPPPYALVSLAESVADGHRIAQIADAKFPVAPGLEWFSVAAGVTAEGFYWNGTTAIAIPAPPSPAPPQAGALPVKLA